MRKCMGVLAVFLIGVGGCRQSSQKWPRGVESMAAAAGAESSDVKVECVFEFIDSEHVWQMPVPVEKLKAAVGTCGMTELKATDAPPEFWQAFRSWRLEAEPDSRCFSTPDFPASERGMDGKHYYAVYLPRHKSVYVWYKSNF